MACEEPLRGYKASTGRLVFFKKTEKEYYQEPYTGLQVPCGKCILCREEYARQTAVKITHEATCHEQNAFVTLTYRNENLPTHGSLNYDDTSKFLKRLRQYARRKYGNDFKLRYYLVGEYGDRSKRAHYHLCLFGLDFTEGAILCQSEPHRLWINLELQKLWGLGDVKIGALTFATARYTASYVTKKLRSKQRYVRIDEETGELVALVQPKAFMSDNLGKAWWEKYGHQLEHHDYVIIDGTEQKPPKAYDRWLLERDPDRIAKIKQLRQERAKPQTKEQNRARARSAHARVGKKSKSI